MKPVQRFPDFFLAGAPKCGTTALYRYLNQHPALYLSPIKEPHFFADEVRRAAFCSQWRSQASARAAAQQEYLRGEVREPFSGGPVEDLADYLKLFRNAGPGQLTGEGSTCYLWSPSAARNIARVIPGAKILVVLRNPVERAFSQYLHTLTFADRKISFANHIQLALDSPSQLLGEIYPFLHFGLYSSQLARYYQHFPPEQIHVGLYDDYVAHPRRFVQQVFRFLGVDADFQPDFSQRYMEPAVPRSWLAQRALRGSTLKAAVRSLLPASARAPLRKLFYRRRHALQMSAADRNRLADLYRDDVARLSRMLGRDLSAWMGAAAQPATSAHIPGPGTALK
jgi:hypothetical protein